MKILWRIVIERTDDVFVIAETSTEAEQLVKKSFSEWAYFDPIILSIHRVAEHNQYGKPNKLIIVPNRTK